MLKSIKMGLLCFCVINLSVACSSEDPSITDETPGQNTGNGGNENEGGEEETPAETRYAFPGAYGAGRYTTGGAGGEVYTVTSLEDNDNTTQGTLRIKSHGKAHDRICGKRIDRTEKPLEDNQRRCNDCRPECTG